jgi:hypothetical protein
MVPQKPPLSCLGIPVMSGDAQGVWTKKEDHRRRQRGQRGQQKAERYHPTAYQTGLEPLHCLTPQILMPQLVPQMLMHPMDLRSAQRNWSEVASKQSQCWKRWLEMPVKTLTSCGVRQWRTLPQQQVPADV